MEAVIYYYIHSPKKAHLNLNKTNNPFATAKKAIKIALVAISKLLVTDVPLI
jgi:hypothetical protein